MPRTVQSFEATPNPNALKCVLDGALPAMESHAGPASRSYRSAQAASGDPLAAALFAAAPGAITSVLIHEHWITVNKAPSADWKTVKAAVTAALSALP